MATTAPPRPVLRPGWQAVRRDDAHLQVGLDEPHRVVLPDSPEVRCLLAALADPALPWRPPQDLPARRALDRLLAAGLVVPRPATAMEARLAARHGPGAAERLGRRARARVRLDGPSVLTEPLGALLHEAGLAGVTGRGEPALTVLVAAGPIERERADDLLRAGRPHLLVAAGPLGWAVGPLVVAGLTACLRCVDAALAEADPRRGVVLAQHSAVPTGLLDPLARTVALAMAAQQAVAFVDGDEPVAWSATLELGDGAPRVTTWRRHPHCGCAWDALAVR